uniref:Uncharacterized protein n=1 Tax=Cacopsylla melanoneura TaxID=428564 RepID=A0A8D8LG46_9HEMI
MGPTATEGGPSHTRFRAPWLLDRSRDGVGLHAGYNVLVRDGPSILTQGRVQHFRSHVRGPLLTHLRFQPIIRRQLFLIFVFVNFLCINQTCWFHNIRIDNPRRSKHVKVHVVMIFETQR